MPCDVPVINTFIANSFICTIASHKSLPSFIPDNAFIYCDPPYANTKKYKDDFDNDRFWEWCRQIIATKDNVKILISEYTAPDDFICVWSVNVQDKMGSKSMNKTEKLFIRIRRQFLRHA